ncbi:hypothetical protein KC19_3G162500 [Ceratodon purpureus]|uniref:Uncharacterized protein n=1 Tax=Ceratodon purpureus TaxID=3225 RepID=A0A8T0IL72_CERPU|nr:hypothetical protein KC19_3G162500 [Ceratodon purpureus]
MCNALLRSDTTQLPNTCKSNSLASVLKTKNTNTRTHYQNLITPNRLHTASQANLANPLALHHLPPSNTNKNSTTSTKTLQSDTEKATTHSHPHTHEHTTQSSPTPLHTTHNIQIPTTTPNRQRQQKARI